MEAGKSNIKVLADLVPGESPLPDLQTAAFLLCLPVTFLGVWAQREKELCLFYL